MVFNRCTALSGCEVEKENQDCLWRCTWEEEKDEVKWQEVPHEILKLRRYILWVDNKSPRFSAVFKNGELTPKCLLLYPPFIQQTGSKREMKGKDIPRATAPCKDKERDRDNLDPPLRRSCRWRGWTERAPSVSYIPLVPQTNPIKLDFSRTVAEHKWQQL